MKEGLSFNTSRLLIKNSLAAKKDRAISDLIKALQAKRKDTFQRWSTKTKALKLSELMNKEKKRYLFSKLNKYLIDTIQYNQQKAFSQYKNFTKYARLKKKFLLGLY